MTFDDDYCPKCGVFVEWNDRLTHYEGCMSRDEKKITDTRKRDMTRRFLLIVVMRGGVQHNGTVFAAFDSLYKKKEYIKDFKAQYGENNEFIEIDTKQYSDNTLSFFHLIEKRNDKWEKIKSN